MPGSNDDDETRPRKNRSAELSVGYDGRPLKHSGDTVAAFLRVQLPSAMPQHACLFGQISRSVSFCNKVDWAQKFQFKELSL
jgi:hypothetical protein